MAVFESTKLRAHLATLLNIDELEQWSRETGLFVRAPRRIRPGILVATFVLGSIVLPRRTISALQRLLTQLAGNSCAYASFYERIGPPLTRVLQRLFTHLLEHTPGPAIPYIFDDRVDEVLALDSCIVRLWDGLCGRWPSTVEGKAGLKLHLVCNVIGATANRLKVGKEPDSENGPWKRLGPWVGNKLLLMDRGYEDFHLFYRIDHNGGFFLTPLKSKRNPLIIKELRTHRGRAIKLEGCKLQDVLERLEREFIDVEVDLEFKKRVYRGKRRKKRWRCRLIGQRRPEGGYWLYLTNLSPEMMSAQDAWNCYRQRWQIELLIRRMRQQLSLDSLSSANEELVEALLWGSLCALALVGALHQRLWPQARAEVCAKVLSEQGNALAWLWANEALGRVLTLDDYLDRQMLSRDPGRQFSCDFLDPRPPPPLQDAA